jgi:hypothetical protein
MMMGLREAHLADEEMHTLTAQLVDLLQRG